MNLLPAQEVKKVKPGFSLRGELRVPADKSISHRAVILGALAEGTSVVHNFLRAQDTLSTVACIRRLGIRVEEKNGTLIVHGEGREGLKEPEDVLDCGNSGTTMRLLCGLLAGQKFFSVLTGDNSLRRRPMRRVVEPLGKMGAEIRGRQEGAFAPLAIKGRLLSAIEYTLPVASAQVKSALLLAGMYAAGGVVVREQVPSRDHTERMLKNMGADLFCRGGEIRLAEGSQLKPQEFVVPGDISSAAFFLVGAVVVPGSEVFVREVGINPTRAGIITVLKEMGARIEVENIREENGEPVADLRAFYSPLRGVEIGGELIPRLIDELPVLAVAMAKAEGRSVVRDAGELRVKETDRIRAVCANLSQLGVDIVEAPDGFVVRGGNPFQGGKVSSFGDHRLAMAMAIAALGAEGEVEIEGAEAVAVSYPGFWEDLERLCQV